MKTTSILVLVALATSGCATSPSSSLPACDGKHRRPANPHGSVLVAPAPAVADWVERFIDASVQLPGDPEHGR
jgi:hypothetical protein